MPVISYLMLRSFIFFLLLISKINSFIAEDKLKSDFKLLLINQIILELSAKKIGEAI